MKRWLTWVLLSGMVLVALSACDRIILGSSSPSTYISVAPTWEPLPCPTKFVQPATSSQNSRTNIAPPYEEIEDSVRCIRGGKESSLSEDVRNKIESYENKLLNLSVNAWEGWISSVGPTYMHESTYSFHIYMSDPFRDNRPTDAHLSSSTWPRDDVQIDEVTQARASQFSVGQKVRFSGSIYKVEPFAPLAIRNASVEFVSGNMVEQLAYSDAEVRNSTITLRNYGGWAYRDSTYTIHGDGTATYDYDSQRQSGSDAPLLLTMPTATQSTGPTPTSSTQKKATITDEQVRELIAIFERADFFSLNDQYTSYDLSDSSSTDISITIGGRTKKVVHYNGAASTPRRLLMVEESIDQVVRPLGFDK